MAQIHVKKGDISVTYGENDSYLATFGNVYWDIL